MRAVAPRLMVAGTSSGSGKTTVACGLICALMRRGLRVQACKCGPDYIDPMFHERVVGAPSRNLDLFLADENLVHEQVAVGAQTSDVTVIEGVMGYYDGIAQSADASSFDVARATNTPVLLVVDGRGRALSVAAEILGFLQFRTPSCIEGVLLNGVSAGYYPALKATVEHETGISVLGYLPHVKDAHFESRHLGLVSAKEIADLQHRVHLIGDTLEQCVDIDALLQIARSAPYLVYDPRELPAPCKDAPLIAIARDAAFDFCYAATIQMFEQLGARIAYFSPLEDTALPEGTSGLYLCGGYPELHARRLSENTSLRAQIRTALAEGMPAIAECGGFLYLHEVLEDDSGVPWPMVGVLPGRAYRSSRLGNFGYVELTAREDGLLAHKGEHLRAHEFHYWKSEHEGSGYWAQKPQSSRGWDCVVSTPSLHAGFPHLYLYANPDAATRFVQACAAFGRAGGVL